MKLTNGNKGLILGVVVAIIIVVAFATGRVGGLADRLVPTKTQRETATAVKDADIAATAADKAAISARKAADSTRSTADSAQDSAKDASEAAKDSANVSRPNK